MESKYTKGDLKTVAEYLVERCAHLNRGGSPLQFGQSEFKYVKNVDFKVSVTKSLETNGFAVIKNYMSLDLTDTISRNISKFHDSIAADLSKIKTDQDKGKYLIVGSEHTKLKNYGDLVNFGKSVIRKSTNLEGGIDEGFVKYFNSDNLFTQHSNEINQYLRNPFLAEILSPLTDPASKFKNIDVYYNNSVTVTRGFHVDTDVTSARLFLYLTDVNDLDDGPYCYVLGSHSDPILYPLNREIGKILNKNELDCDFFNQDRIKKFVVPRGRLIVGF